MRWSATGSEEEEEELEKTAALQKPFGLAKGGPLDKAISEITNSDFAFFGAFLLWPPPQVQTHTNYLMRVL